MQLQYPAECGEILSAFSEEKKSSHRILRKHKVEVIIPFLEMCISLNLTNHTMFTAALDHLYFLFYSVLSIECSAALLEIHKGKIVSYDSQIRHTVEKVRQLFGLSKKKIELSNTDYKQVRLWLRAEHGYKPYDLNFKNAKSEVKMSEEVFTLLYEFGMERHEGFGVLLCNVYE